MATLTIGEVAGAAEVGVETIRFYERRGLIDEPPRRASGYRQYPPEAVARIRFIRRAKELGFSLREIKELLECRVDPHATSGDVKGRAKAKIVDIDGKIESLQRMRTALQELVTACSGRGPVTECSILEAMDTETEEES